MYTFYSMHATVRTYKGTMNEMHEINTVGKCHNGLYVGPMYSTLGPPKISQHQKRPKLALQNNAVPISITLLTQNSVVLARFITPRLQIRPFVSLQSTI